MIPNKLVKFRKKAPVTDAQKLAQQENFAIFQIKSIVGRLHHMKSCATVPQSSVLSVIHTLESIEKKIKYTQAKRKEGRNKNGS